MCMCIWICICICICIRIRIRICICICICICIYAYVYVSVYVYKYIYIRIIMAWFRPCPSRSPRSCGSAARRRWTNISCLAPAASEAKTESRTGQVSVSRWLRRIMRPPKRRQNGDQKYMFRFFWILSRLR